MTVVAKRKAVERLRFAVVFNVQIGAPANIDVRVRQHLGIVDAAVINVRLNTLLTAEVEMGGLKRNRTADVDLLIYGTSELNGVVVTTCSAGRNNQFAPCLQIEIVGKRPIFVPEESCKTTFFNNNL